MKKTANSNFFETQTASSRIKANIVANYFPAYARIILKSPQKQIRYLDLFAGPGKYKDGNHSTPLLIAEECANDFQLKDKVYLMFNDNEHGNALKVNFQNLFSQGTFKFKPRFASKTVGEDKQIQEYLSKDFGKPNPHPTLLFFDPWGYKGIDTITLSKFLENWGNEIFLFVNIKRIHAAILNNKFDQLMRHLFPTTFEEVKRERRYTSNVHERLNLIMEKLSNEFRKHVKDKLYDCSFKFQEEDSKATSHYIVHFTKHKKGYELVKQIYYDFDNLGATLDNDGNYTFDAKKMDIPQSNSFQFGDENLRLLSEQLEEEFKGRTLTAKRLFDIHHGKTLFCGTHYVKTLRNMVDERKVQAEFIDDINHKVSVLLNDNCKLIFK